MKKVCLDTNIIVKLLLIEEDSNIANELYQKLIKLDWQISVPEYLIIETYSVIIKQRVRGFINGEMSKWAIEAFNNLNIEYFNNSSLLAKAFEIAIKLDELSIYDSMFLAYAMSNSIPIITSDAKLYKKAKKIYKKVYNLKEALNLFDK